MYRSNRHFHSQLIDDAGRRDRDLPSGHRGAVDVGDHGLNVERLASPDEAPVAPQADVQLRGMHQDVDRRSERLAVDVLDLVDHEPLSPDHPPPLRMTRAAELRINPLL